MVLGRKTTTHFHINGVEPFASNDSIDYHFGQPFSFGQCRKLLEILNVLITFRYWSQAVYTRTSASWSATVGRWPTLTAAISRSHAVWPIHQLCTPLGRQANDSTPAQNHPVPQTPTPTPHRGCMPNPTKWFIKTWHRQFMQILYLYASLVAVTHFHYALHSLPISPSQFFLHFLAKRAPAHWKIVFPERQTLMLRSVLNLLSSGLDQQPIREDISTCCL